MDTKPWMRRIEKAVAADKARKELQRIKDDMLIDEIRASWRTRLEDIYGTCDICGSILSIDGDCPNEVHHALPADDLLWIED